MTIKSCIDNLKLSLGTTEISITNQNKDQEVKKVDQLRDNMEGDRKEFMLVIAYCERFKSLFRINYLYVNFLI